MAGRARVVFGSLLGAATIHLVFLACGSPRIQPSDGGMIDAALDAMGLVGDAETRDAVAQEAGGSCSCPEPTRTTFSGGIDLGSGVATVRTQASSASAAIAPYIFASGDSGYRVFASSSFWLASSPFQYSVTCVLYFGGGAGQTARAPSSCSVSEARDGAATWSGQATAVNATLATVNDGALDVTINDAAATSGGRTITIRSMRFQMTGAGVIPTAAYRP